MAVEVAVLLGAARAATEVLKQSRELVGQMQQSGWFKKNDEAKKKLEEQLASLERNLHDVGKLAEYGEDYTRRHEEVLELLWDCERARSFLKENEAACSDTADPNYASSWRVLYAIRESMSKRREPILNALDDHGPWFDERDRNQMEERRQTITVAFERVSGDIRVQAAVDARHHLDALIEELEHIEGALNRTLYDGIFQSLQELAA
jgi:hypothetical protein